MKIAVLKSQPRTGMALLLILSSVLLLPAAANGVTYRVGPDEQLSKVSEIADKLEAGDVVEITGDIIDTFALTAHGTKDKPITIRGLTRVEDGSIMRPRITAEPSAGKIIICKGDWTVLEGLDISGQNDNSFRQGAVIQECSNLTLRNCRIHHCLRAFCGYEESAGDVRFEFCEFYANGYAEKPPVSLYSNRPGATAVVEHCFFLDGTGGNFLRICMPRSVVLYNWFENPYEHALQVSTPELAGPARAQLAEQLLPAHCDIVGNVFLLGWGPGSAYCALSLGGDSPEAPGTEGDFNIAHNLFVTRRGGVTPQVPVLVHGTVDHVNFYNNVFLEGGVRGMLVYSRENVWDGPRLSEFIKKRGSGDPVVAGANNWVSQTGMGVPTALRDTMRGVDPLFMNLVGYDFHPQPDSPLAATGLWPLPEGRVCALIPEYEPQRGIPVDLKPVRRRKVVVPSIGPFEASATAPPFDDDSADLVLGVKDSGGRFAWPFDFGGARRTSLELLSQGKPDEALSWAKREFVFSPMEATTLEKAIGHVRQMLVVVDGDNVRAQAFAEFAKHGPAGSDGKQGTSDDMADPIADVELPNVQRTEDDRSAFEMRIDAREAMGTGMVWPMTESEGWWYATEKAFARLEANELDSGPELLVAVLAEVARKPTADFDGQKVLQRNQGILERTLAGLSVVARVRRGSLAGVPEFVAVQHDYARYGPAGRDGRMGTGDDLSIAIVLAGEDAAGDASPEEQPEGEPQKPDDPAKTDETLQAFLEPISDAKLRALHKLQLIASTLNAGKRSGFLWSSPTAKELMNDIQTGLSTYRRRWDSLDADEKARLEPLLRRERQAAATEVIRHYSAILATNVSAADVTKARAYVSAYMVATSSEETYPIVLTVLTDTVAEGQTPTFLISDLVGPLDDPFLAGDVFDAIDAVNGAGWTRAERTDLVDALEQAQYARIVAADRRAVNSPKDAADIFAEASAQCVLYLDRFPAHPHAIRVEFQRGFYEYRCGNFQPAMEQLNAFVANHPDDPLVPSALFTRALAAMNAGDSASAIHQLQDVAERYPKSIVAARALYLIGRAHFRSQEFDKAREVLLRVVDFYPNDKCAASARALLEKLDAGDAQ